MNRWRVIPSHRLGVCFAVDLMVPAWLHISKETFRPELRLGWHHEFMDTARTIESQMASGAGTVFQVQGPSVGRDSLSVVTGLSTRCSQHLSIFAYYDGELACDNAASHSVNGGLSWDF
ncbi:MAG: autotransporter domain-containing protein [Limisphaerales bacterium]